MTVNGEPTTGTSADGTYTFEVKNSENEVAATKTITITNGVSNEVTVEDLLPGDYTVSEDTNKNPDGMTLVGENDIKVEVTADQTTEIPTAEFTNDYSTRGDITFSGKKTLKNRKLNEGEFEFELYDTNEESEKLLQTVTNTADGSYSFAKIYYTGADLDMDADGNYITTTKKYTVIEKTGALKGVIYDTRKYDITVTLKDDGKGTIEATATPDKSSFNFTNEYEATGKVTLKVKKAVTGASWPKGGKVTLTVTAKDEVPMPEKTSVTLSAAGLADFGAIKYTIDDEGNAYTYIITETSGFGSDWTAVPEKITATVIVGEDNGDGTLKESKVTYDPKDATITNTYSKKSSKSEVKTGDRTPIAHYLILFLAAAMIILEESIRRLRKTVLKK